VKEYLISAHASFMEVDASSLIAESCLRYLLEFTEPGSLNDKNIHEFQLATYAATHWIQHMQDVEQRNNTLDSTHARCGTKEYPNRSIEDDIRDF
jgi:hypothetical protein